MIGAIVLSGLARGEIISLTLAPLLLVSMIILIRFGAGAWSLDSRLLRLTGAAEPTAEQMSGRRIVVRAATARDESALARIYRRASLANPGDRPALLAHPEVLRLPKDIVTSGRTRVASISGTIIGFARTRATADEVIEPDDLFVDPDWQRQGAARSLMQALVREAVHERVTRIEVTANQHALGFYHAMGFVGDLPTTTTLGSGLRMHLDVAAVR